MSRANTNIDPKKQNVILTIISNANLQQIRLKKGHFAVYAGVLSNRKTHAGVKECVSSTYLVGLFKGAVRQVDAGQQLRLGRGHVLNSSAAAWIHGYRDSNGD